MKKKPNVRAGEPAFRKICTVMKLCLVLSLLAVLSVSARGVAQNVKLSMEKKSVSLLNVLNELGEKSGYEFFYNDDEVTGVKVSVSAKDATVQEILDQVLKGTSLTYHIVDDVFIITPKKATDEKKNVWRISGVVKDNKGELLPGVTVVIKGTQTGTATDANGKFKIEFLDAEKKSVTLVFSFIGMVTQEREIKEYVKDLK